ncbi:hypothetical protein [Sulfobacillus thermosulfidooxidans]|uniref:hypothetical protein n=1 Tax=Sulfobacillus thermosulfidooxidans TaxID=28034 RepID=UPI0006B519BC|nr:hypothetical protein [Sulfobacillus thermosulfidooxidans]
MDDEVIFQLTENQEEWYYFRLSPREIKGHGGSMAPALIISPRLYRESRQDHSIIPKYGSEVRALAVSLYQDNDGFPLVTSGLQYFKNSYCVLPLNRPMVEFLSHQIQIILSFDVWLSQDIDPENLILLRTKTHPITLDQTHWQTQVLPQLGYPETRMVPLSLTLPRPSTSDNPLARATWSSNIKQFEQAVKLFRTWHFEPTDLVQQLRPIIENTLTTWLHIWNLPIPSSGKSNDMLQTLNKALQPDDLPTMKPCNAPNGIIPVSTPHKRLCIVLTMLHDLLSLSNIEHHAHSQGTFTMADAESLLYMTTGILRSLPQLWKEYPTPPTSPVATS